MLLVLWEQSYDESHYTYHPHENLPGFLLVLLRVGLATLFGYNLHNKIQTEKSALRKNFYRSFSIVRLQWYSFIPLYFILPLRPIITPLINLLLCILYAFTEHIIYIIHKSIFYAAIFCCDYTSFSLFTRHVIHGF